MVEDLLILFLVVLAVNLLPAFAPPTWSIVAGYGIASSLPLPALVLTAAAAAATGRLLLAQGFRRISGVLPERLKANLDAARQVLAARSRNMKLALALFALSPLPSAQLFEAAGLTRLPLLRFTDAFFAGRLVSYSIYGLTARAVRDTTFGQALRGHLTNPLALGAELLMIALLIALLRMDWRRRLPIDRLHRPATPPARQSESDAGGDVP